MLLGAISITENEAGAESVYYCAACRIANLLDLANKSTADGLEREVNIRGKSFIMNLHVNTERYSMVVAVYDRCLVFSRCPSAETNAIHR